MNSTQLFPRAARLVLAASLLAGGGGVMLAAPAQAAGVATVNINMMTVPADTTHAFTVSTVIDGVPSAAAITDHDPDLDATSGIVVADEVDGGSQVTVEQVEEPGWLTDIMCSVRVPDGQFQVAAVQDGPFNLIPGDILDCTITNTRGAQISVGKTLAGDPTGDTFNLTVDEQPVLVGTDGTGPGETVTVPAGTHTIAETAAGPDTNLSGYFAFIKCSDSSTPGFPLVAGPVVGPAETTSLDVTVAVGDVVGCLVFNIRKSTIAVAKEVVGDPGDDSFDLIVNSEPALVGAVDGSASDPVVFEPTLLGEEVSFAVIVEERAGPGTDLQDYTSEIVCTVGETIVAGPKAGPALSNFLLVFPPPGADVVCTVTNTRQASAPDLTIAVEGEDPTFEIDGPAAFLETREIDPGQSVTLADVPPGEYTITITDPDDVVVEAVDCDPEEASFDLDGRSVTVIVGDTDVDCLFTIAHADDNDYNQYPGDTDFDFDTPFQDSDDDDSPAPPAVAGEVLNNVGGQNGAGDPQATIAGDPGVAPAPAGDVAPQAVTDLPRTGSGLTPGGLRTGVLMIMAGVAALLGGRRRRASQA